MDDSTPSNLVRSPGIVKLFAGDPFFERAQQIGDMIAHRAFQLFEFGGCIHGSDLDHWIQAESEILRTTPLDVAETETELIVRAEVPGFNDKELEIRVEPRRLFITGERREASEGEKGNAIYSERRCNRIFRVLDLSATIDPDAVKATLSDGLLEVTLAKAEISKKIPVLTKSASA